MQGITEILAALDINRGKPLPATLAYAKRFVTLLNPSTSELTAEQLVIALTDGIIAGCTNDAAYPAVVNADDNAALVTALVATAIAISRTRI